MATFKGTHWHVVDPLAIGFDTIFFKTYLEEIHSFVKGEERKLKEEFENLKKSGKFSESEINQAYEELSDDLLKSGQHLSILHESFIVSIYSYFEAKLDFICNDYIKKNNPNVLLKDLKGTGIFRAHIFLKKVAKYKLPEEKIWLDILMLNRVRNSLVHSLGEINDQDLLKYISKVHFLNSYKSFFEGVNMIGVSKEYCLHAVEIVENYLIGITDLNNKYYSD